MTDRTPITMLDPEALTPGTYVLSVTGTGAAKKFTVVADTSSTPAAASVTYAGSTNLAATNVEAALDELDAEKAAVGHTHVKANITDLGTIGTAAALNIPASGDAAAGEVVKGSDTRLTNARTPTAHAHVVADTTGLQAALDGKATTGHTHVAQRVRATTATATVLSTGALTVIPLETEDYDSLGLHDTVTNNSRITFDRVGLWLIFGQVSYATSSVGRRMATVRLNGAEVARAQLPASSAGFTYVPVSTPVVASAVGDYVDLLGFQDTGGNLTISAANTFLTAIWIGA